MNQGPHPAFPDRLTPGALQAYVAAMVKARAFTQDLDRVFILWVEELGELAELIPIRHADSEDAGALRGELADVVLYVADLANGFGVDLDSELATLPPWPVPQGTRTPTVSDWQAAAPDPGVEEGQTAMIDLVRVAGELARIVRKRWSGQVGGAAPLLVRAFGLGVRLARAARIDLTAAIREKEQENATRAWSY
jgi:NTP pyrophosphatase (non-canonical NTP hydrolase)